MEQCFILCVKFYKKNEVYYPKINNADIYLDFIEKKL